MFPATAQLTSGLNRACGRPSAEPATDCHAEAAQVTEARAREAAERRAVAAETALAREVAARAAAEAREATALEAAAVREEEWQRATERVAAQREATEQFPSGIRVRGRAPTLSCLACSCGMALRGVRHLIGAAAR